MVSFADVIPTRLPDGVDYMNFLKHQLKLRAEMREMG